VSLPPSGRNDKQPWAALLTYETACQASQAFSLDVVTQTAADWDALQRAVDGAVVAPDSPDYELARRSAMARFDDVRPAAVVRCTSPDDVSATIAFAARAGLQTAVRSGGHSVAGRSSTEGLVIDVTPMSSVSAGDGVATVGTGARLGDLYDALDQQGLTIPAGCGPSVGIGGLTLGGGIGVLGRKYGLTCDQLLSADVVLADGQLVRCDEHHDEELFWALRGAGGGNFGVVVSFVFRTLPAPAATVFHVTWPFADAVAVVDAWQAWAPAAPDELDATLRLIGGGVGAPPRVELLGSWLGSESQASQLVDQVVALARAEPSAAAHRHLGYRDAKRYLDELGGGGAADEPPRDHLFTKSEFFRHALPRDTIAALVEDLRAASSQGESREVAFLPWGGAYNRVPVDATAFPHRQELFLVQHLLLVDPEIAATTGEAAHDWLNRSWSRVHPYAAGGVYSNFPDPDLRDWTSAYYGPNYERLLRVKAKYDPSNLFRFDQSLAQ
jgi:FAD/FMN-containing dehydrogenase